MTFPSAFIFPAAWRVFVRKHRKVCCSLLQWCDVGAVVWRRTCTVRFFRSLLRLFSSFLPIWMCESGGGWGRWTGEVDRGTGGWVGRGGGATGWTGGGPWHTQGVHRWSQDTCSQGPPAQLCTISTLGPRVMASPSRSSIWHPTLPSPEGYHLLTLGFGDGNIFQAALSVSNPDHSSLWPDLIVFVTLSWNQKGRCTDFHTLQQAAYNAQLQQAAYNAQLQQAAYNTQLQQAAYNAQQHTTTTSSLQCTTHNYNKQPTTHNYNKQPTTHNYNKQPTMHNNTQVQQAAYNAQVQQAAYNAQHTTTTSSLQCTTHNYNKQPTMHNTQLQQAAYNAQHTTTTSSLQCTTHNYNKQPTMHNTQLQQAAYNAQQHTTTTSSLQCTTTTSSLQRTTTTSSLQCTTTHKYNKQPTMHNYNKQPTMCKCTTHGASQHVVHERPQAPPVHSLPVACPHQDLWGPDTDRQLF